MEERDAFGRGFLHVILALEEGESILGHLIALEEGGRQAKGGLGLGCLGLVSHHLRGTQ
jgi:hypothetical protein